MDVYFNPYLAKIEGLSKHKVALVLFFERLICGKSDSCSLLKDLAYCQDPHNSIIITYEVQPMDCRLLFFKTKYPSIRCIKRFLTSTTQRFFFSHFASPFFVLWLRFSGYSTFFYGFFSGILAWEECPDTKSGWFFSGFSLIVQMLLVNNTHREKDKKRKKWGELII